MAVEFWNIKYSYENGRGKSVFVPNDMCLKKGYELKGLIERVDFDPFYYHLRKGGHVAALHAHRPQRWFARVDIERFFYSISRNRVARSLYEIGVPKAGDFAKWSCVKSPYGSPAYALPYGFAQSPILATLVLSRSPVGDFLRSIVSEVVVSAYVDDIAISGNDRDQLDVIFTQLAETIREADFSVNATKTAPTGEAIELFNCDLRFLRTAVTDERKGRFYSEKHTGDSEDGFDRYCLTIEEGNG